MLCNKVCLICIVISSRGHLQANAMWMKSFTNMSCKSIRLFETILSSSKTMQAYLQYGNELFASWPYHTPLAGLPGPNPSLIGHLWGILGWWVHDYIPYKLPCFPNLNTSLLNNGNVFHKGVGTILLSMRKKLIQCIHKGCGHTRYDLQYINL